MYPQRPDGLNAVLLKVLVDSTRPAMQADKAAGRPVNKLPPAGAKAIGQPSAPAEAVASPVRCCCV